MLRLELLVVAALAACDLAFPYYGTWADGSGDAGFSDGTADSWKPDSGPDGDVGGRRSIDPFGTIDGVSATAGQPASTTQDDPQILGGERDIVVHSEGDSVSVGTSGGRALAFATGSSSGTVQIVWDGKDNDPTSIDYEGLGGADLGQGYLDLTLLTLDQAWQECVRFEIDVYSDAANWSRFSSTNKDLFGLTEDHLSLQAPITATIEPQQFIPQEGMGASFSNVGAISFTITTLNAGVDLTIGPLIWR